MSDLTVSVNGQGKHAQAGQMQRELLDVQGLVLGPEHPDTLTTMSNLAVTLRVQGRHVEAKRISQDGVPIREPRTSSAPLDPHLDAPPAKRARQ
jgi:hypothetical protein